MILPLSHLISSAVEQTLEDRVAVSFSGGLDSTIIAAIAKKHADVELFSAGMPGSEDLDYSGRVAQELDLPLQKLVLDEPGVMDAYARCHATVPLGLLKVEILVPVYRVAEAAAARGHSVVLFGSGAEELFVGYERYYSYLAEGNDLDSLLREEFRTLPQRDIGWMKKICRKFNLEARFPFYNKKLADTVFAVPLEERMHDRELKKGLLREAAKMLHIPDTAIARRKKAMQYGSGIHKVLMRRSGEINRAYPAL